MSSPDLGIDQEDRERLTEEVSIVFHCAASLRLEGKLKDLANTNLSGTKRVIELCYEMKKLEVPIQNMFKYTISGVS